MNLNHMKYTLIGSLRSPFVRICRMLFIKNQIEFEFKVLNFVDDPKDAAELEKETPINKVPVLIDGGQKIFDSRVIVNHMIRKHGLKPLSLQEENIVTAIYSCMDTGVLLFLMKRDGYETQGDGFFISRQNKRIPRNLEYIKPWLRTLDAKDPQDWNYLSMSLYSFLYWAQARQIYDHRHDPELVGFMQSFATAPGVSETSF